MIGIGHVVETLTLARILIERGGAAVIWVSEETPVSIMGQFPLQVGAIENFGIPRLRRLAAEIHERGIQGVVTNFRSITNEQVDVLKKEELRVLCIDEWGNRHLNCNAVVNTSPVEEYHCYSSDNPDFRLYGGVAYLSLSGEFQKVHCLERYHKGPICSIAVSMGGVDRTGATIRLVEALLMTGSNYILHIVIGPGFAHRQKLESMLAAVPAGRFEVHENLSSLADLFFQCDVAFTAGGNTLAELACAGTPALVVSEDLHEEKQGKAFESRGFGQWIGRGTSISQEQICHALVVFDDPEIRNQQCKTGKALVDGKGALRILDAASRMYR